MRSVTSFVSFDVFLYVNVIVTVGNCVYLVR